MGSTVEELAGIFPCLAGHVADVGDSRRRIERLTGSAGREARIKGDRQGTRGQDTAKIDKNGTSGAGAAGALGGGQSLGPSPDPSSRGQTDDARLPA